VLAAVAFVSAGRRRRDPTEAESGALSEEVITRTAIREHTEVAFQQIGREHDHLRTGLIRSVRIQVATAVYAPPTERKLKKVVKDEIAVAWAKTVARIEGQLTDLVRGAAAADLDRLRSLFLPVYQACRRQWLSSLYRSPMVISSFLLVLLIVFGRELSGLRQYPRLWMIAHEAWVPLLPLLMIVLYVAARWWLLAPRRQFLAPRHASSLAVPSQSAEETSPAARSTPNRASSVSRLRPTMVPNLGIATGVEADFFWEYFTGRDLKQTKHKVNEQLIQEIQQAAAKLESRLGEWIQQKKSDLEAAAVESFMGNVHRLSELLGKNRYVSKRVATEAGLLPRGGATRVQRTEEEGARFEPARPSAAPVAARVSVRKRTVDTGSAIRNLPAERAARPTRSGSA
jgi:hypothetical protein